MERWKCYILHGVLCACALALIVSFSFDLSDLLGYQILFWCYLLATGFIIARYALGIPSTFSVFLAPLASATPIIIAGSVIYTLSSLSVPAFIFLLLLPLCGALMSIQRPRKGITGNGFEPLSWKDFCSIILTVLCIGSFFISIFHNRTLDSLLGPWDHISSLPFILYFTGSLILITILLRIKNALAGLTILVIHFLASFSVALIKFPLSFGFDPLLHNAAEKLVLVQGSVTPKTLYYIGQYVLVPFLSRLLNLPVEWIHQPLLPILLACSLPVLLTFAGRIVFGWSISVSLTMALLFLLIPYPHLIMTTPWGLAYGTTILTILSSGIAVVRSDLRFMIATFVLGLVTLFLHPLAGIPLFFFLIIVILLSSKLKQHYKIVLASTLFFLGSISIPVAFIINSRISSQLHVTLNAQLFSDLAQSLHHPSLQTRFLPFLDFSYFFLENGGWIFLILACIGGVLIFKKKEKIHRLFLTISILGAGIFTVNGLLVASFLRFDSLAAFEQSDYGDRMFQHAVLFLVPLAGYTVGLILQRLTQKNNAIMVMVAPIFLAAVLTSSLYLSYPRNDAYAPSHGYTLSSADISAVRFIDNDAAGAPYIVIANQVVASAAIKEFGFAHYYQATQDTPETLFYYPIPTGSPFFQTYLSMLRAPMHATMNDAMNRVGLSRSYFVVRDYEPRFPIIVRDAKKTSDEWHEIGDGKAFVFLYKKQ